MSLMATQILVQESEEHTENLHILLNLSRLAQRSVTLEMHWKHYPTSINSSKISIELCSERSCVCLNISAFSVADDDYASDEHILRMFVSVYKCYGLALCRDVLASRDSMGAREQGCVTIATLVNCWPRINP